MFNTPVPESPGMPVLWWLFWFAAAVAIYLLIALWFWKVMKRETRSADAPDAPEGEPAE